MENASRACAHLTMLGETLIRDLTDSDLASPSTPDGKTAGWLLGHLSVSGDFVRRKFGSTPLTPKDWGPKFGPGTHPSQSASDYPGMEELRTVFEKVYVDLAKIAPTMTAELLDGPSPFEKIPVGPELALARERFPTMGSFASWIMTGHLGYHLGQLSEWKATRAK
jgi:hypothetical protein